MENISKILVMLRMQKALSQAATAKKINVSQSQYSKMENGEKQFPLDKFIALASALSIKPWVLMQCVVIAITKPDDAIKKAIHEINNPASANYTEKEELNYRELATYWEEKYFLLYKEYMDICAKERINQSRKKVNHR